MTLRVWLVATTPTIQTTGVVGRALRTACEIKSHAVLRSCSAQQNAPFGADDSRVNLRTFTTQKMREVEMSDITMELAFVEIESRDLARWKTFAESVLGLATQTRSNSSHHETLLVRADQAAYRIAVTAGEQEKFLRTVFRVGDASDLGRLEARFDAEGVAYQSGSACPLPSGRQGEPYLDVIDPAGLELRFTWGAPEVTEKGLPTGTGISYSSHARGALGHVVALVPDLTQTVDFYTGTLGFEVTDYIGDGPGRLAFLRCNERHHSMAFMAGPETTVDHLMLEVDSLDDLGRVYDTAREVGGTVLSEIGRHTNDLAVSFYLRSPLPSLEIEFATGGIDVPEGWAVDWHKRGSVWGHKRP